MALKINNEAKIGILVIIAVAALIFGLRMLQGKSLFNNGTDLYALYDDASGLQTSAPILLKGVAIGRVKDIQITDQQKIKVTIHLNEGVNIPVGSIAEMQSPSMLSSDKVISIVFPANSSTNYLKDGANIEGKMQGGLVDELKGGLNPIMANVNGTVQNIDSVVLSVNNIMNFQTQQSLRNTIQNLDKAIADLSTLAHALSQQSGQISGIMKSVNGFADNLNQNNPKITNILTNAETATNSLTGPEIKETLKSLQEAADKLNATINNINSTDGSLGLLMRDRALYDNINKMSKSLDELMIDLKNHPGRYINVSVFGSDKRN